MDQLNLYNAIRSEILVNHVLMHLTTIVVVVLLLGGVWLSERRESMVSVLLPLLSLSWAAAILRFDFFIHRQAAYLKLVEAHLRESGVVLPLWETWKASLLSTRVVVPIADLFALLIVLAPTVYLLFGPAREVFKVRGWRGHRVYSWTILLITIGLLCCLPFVPALAAR